MIRLKYYGELFLVTGRRSDCIDVSWMEDVYSFLRDRYGSHAETCALRSLVHLNSVAVVSHKGLLLRDGDAICFYSPASGG